MQNFHQIVAEPFADVDKLIVSQLHSKVGLVENIGQYIVEAGGKRLRPLLTLLSAGALGDIERNHIKLAVVIEFIHTATLLHDDVVDLSQLRRGRPTANAQWGNAPSVLVGDFIYSRAFQMLVDIGDMDVMALLSDTTNTVAEGEVLQLTRAGQPDTTEDDYYAVIHSKTAVLFAAACRGAALISRKPEQADALETYGLQLGLAFQLIDDLLDYEGDPEETGKNIGDDLAEGKPTLPLIRAMQTAGDAEADIIRRAISEKDATHLNDILSIVRDCGALEYTRKAAENASHKAIEALSTVPDSAYRKTMQNLALEALARRA